MIKTFMFRSRTDFSSADAIKGLPATECDRKVRIIGNPTTLPPGLYKIKSYYKSDVPYSTDAFRFESVE